MPAQKQQPSWADIVKGKQASTEPVEQKFQFNPEVQEFQFNPEVQKLKFNPEVQEFKPQVKEMLNPSAKVFDPQLIEKATQMTNLLLECYSDSDDDDEDVVPVRAPKRSALALLNPHANVFAPPETKSLNPSAKDFDPQLMQKAAQMANVLRECYSDADDSDDDSELQKPRALTPVTGTKALACKQLNPLAKVFSPESAAPKVTEDANLPAAVAFRPPPGLTLPDVVGLNMDCYSSDDESLCASPCAGTTRKCASKLAGYYSEDSDSTSAGRTSDSDTESLEM